MDTWILESPEVKSSEVHSVPKSFPLEFFRRSQEDLISYLSNNSSADYQTIKEALNLTEKELSLLLKECQEEGKITKVGLRYFFPDQVIQRDKQNEVILSYVEKHQPVTSAQLTKLLGLVERRQIFYVIGPLLKSGELVRLRVNKYCLPSYQDLP